MADYIVGDIQGCYSGLRRLLAKAHFNPSKDKLWAVGDLISRGPESLETLKYLYSLGDQFETVLGNHDLHFLAIHGGIKEARKSDNLESLLACGKVDKYAAWLRKKPLALKLDKQTLLTHAGLYPVWTFNQAIKFSNEVQHQLTSKRYPRLLTAMYGSEPGNWSNKHRGFKRWRFIINAFTRMRYLQKNGDLEFATKISPSQIKAPLVPWFKVKNPHLHANQRVVFGHWAALLGQTHSSKFIGLDTGYVWGHSMTLFKLAKNRSICVKYVKNENETSIA